MVFPCREVIFSIVFFHPGTSRSSSKSLCSSFRSYVVQFWGFSVLHCHGVFPSRDQQQQQQKPLQQQEEQVAKIHSSSKRKKEPKASFSMGFRSYVRHFRGAILGLLRPSEAWCFAPGRWFFPWCFPIWGPDVKVAKIHSSSKRKKEPKASFSMGFRSYLGIFGVQFWGFSVLQRHGVSPPGGDFFTTTTTKEEQQQQQEQEGSMSHCTNGGIKTGRKL